MADAATLLKPGESFGPNPGDDHLLKPGESFDPNSPGVPNKPSEIAGKAAGAAGGKMPGLPDDPYKIPDKITPPAGGGLKTIGKMLPRIGTQVGGAQIGQFAGEGAAVLSGNPELAPLAGTAGGVVGAGIGNIAGKYLPESLGGDRSESTLHAFGWGAGAELVGRGASSFIEKKAATKGANAAYDDVVAALDKGANPSPAEQAGRVAQTLGRTTLESPKPVTGEALSDAASSLRDDIQAPITDMRVKLGKPIGDSYEALKGKPPISGKDAQDLAEAAQAVKDSAIAPSPKAAVIFAKIKNFVPQATGEGSKNILLEQPGGEVLERPSQLPIEDKGDFFAKLTPEQAKRIELAQTQKSAEKGLYGGKLSFEEQKIAAGGAAADTVKTPTPDELRELRQVIGKRLSTAQGGDRHTLAGLQQAIDEKLMPMLPEGISRDRELYSGFMKRFPWRDVNKIDQMGTPRELGNYVFGGTPERTAEIIESSSSEGKVALREALTNRALDAVNPDAPLKEQVAKIRGVLTPYIKNGTAASLYGSKGADTFREVFYLPEHMQQWKDVVNTPEFKNDMTTEVSNLIRSGNKTKVDAVEEGWNRVLNKLPANTRDMFLKPTLPGAELPALPTAQQAMETGLAPGKSGMAGRAVRRAEFTIPMAVARMSPVYAAGNLIALSGIVGTASGYRAIMENGGAGWVSKAMASQSGRAKARLLIEGLAAIGTQTERVATQPKTPKP